MRQAPGKTRLALSVAITPIIAGFLATGTAHAENTTTEGAAPVEILVTAQRRSESIQSVPVTMQAMGDDFLQSRGVRGAQDLGQFTPNVSINTVSGPGSQPNITIRGIGLTDFNTNNASPNGVYVDEFYLSAPLSQGVAFFDLERVEVLKGPQGTLYGRNTSGGAINLITAKPTQDFQAKAHAEYGSFDSVNVEAAVGGGITDWAAVRVAGVYNYSRGYLRNLLKNRWENGANNGAVRGQLLLTPSPDLDILLKTQYARSKVRPNQYRFVGVADPSTYDPVAILNGAANICSAASTIAGNSVDLFGSQTEEKFYEGNYNVDTKGYMTDWLNSARVDYKLGSIDITSITGFSYNKRMSPSDFDASGYRLVEVRQGSKSHEFTQELRAAQSTDRYNWVAGAFYLRESIKQDQPLSLLHDIDLLFGPGGGDSVAYTSFTQNKQVTKSFALFGQADYEVLEDLRLTVGARYTWDTKSFGANSGVRYQEGGMDNFGPLTKESNFYEKLKEKKFNWRLGLNYKIDPNFMVYGSVATGYKGGGFNGGFLDTDPAIRELQLQPVRPEEVTSYEVGFKSTLFDRAVTFNLAAFYNQYRNQQLLVLVKNPDPTQPSFYALDNAARSRTYGIDADLTIRPTTGLTLGAQLGLLNAKMTEFTANRDPSAPDYSGNYLTYSPKMTLSLSGDYETDIGMGNLKLHYDANYKGKQYFDPSNNPTAVQKSYWIHNARIALGFNDDRYDLGVFARNLTKAKYVIYSSDLTTPVGSLQQVYGMPRVIGVDFNFRY